MTKIFKDFLQQDISNVFVNQGEFAEKAMIEGVEMEIVLDSDMIVAGDKKHQVATYDVVFHVATSYFTEIPRAEKIMDFNGKEYIIASVSDDMGMLKIALLRND